MQNSTALHSMLILHIHSRGDELTESYHVEGNELNFVRFYVQSSNSSGLILHINSLGEVNIHTKSEIDVPASPILNN